MPGRWLMVAGMVATVCLIVALLFNQDRAREQTALVAAQAEIWQDALRLTAQIEQLLDATDRLALFTVSDILTLIDAPDRAGTHTHWWDDPRLIGDRVAFLPWLASLVIADGSGVVRVTTGPLAQQGHSIADRPYFKSLQQGQSIAFALDQDGLTNPAPLLLARPLISEDGQFFGVVTLTIRRQALATILSQTDDQHPATTELTFLDGTVIAAFVPGEAGQLDADHVLTARQELQAAPLVLSLRQSAQYIHANFWTDRFSSLLISVVLSAFAAALTYLTLRWLRERDRMMAALEASSRAAEAANRDKDGILALVAHELRTPLNAIAGFTELIEAETHGPLGAPEYALYLHHVREGAEQMQEMINRILDFSKLRAGRMTLTMEQLDLCTAARAVYGMLTALAAQNDITLILAEPLPDDCCVQADPAATRQMVTNLISNAIKFTPAGGTISLVLQAEVDKVLLTVSDTGIGMDRDDIRTALQPFGQNRTAQFRTTAGTGLGLPMVVGLIELHGGRLLIDSAKGQGTRMTLVFPRQPANGGGEADYSPTLPISKNLDRRSDFN